MPDATTLVKKIIEEQELIIGPLAWREAGKVPGLHVEADKSIVIRGNIRDVLSDLVTQYEELFGPASREICRETARQFLPEMNATDIPKILR